MSKKRIKLNTSHFQPLSAQTGKLYAPLTNDVLFKLLMQKNKKVLRAFLCALLKLKPSQIISVQITNTYVPGETIDDKQIILDINLILNNSKIINLEMQVLNEGDWKERSIFYLCRNFGGLECGDTYTNVLPTHHIGILDFTLPEFGDAFYYNFYLFDDKTYKKYSDKLILSVLNLNETDKASEEDKASGLQYWARLFKATTWEEIKMLTKQNDIFESAANTINELLQEHQVRVDCERRRMNLNAERAREALVKEQAETITEQLNTINDLSTQNARQAARIAQLEALIKEKDI